MSASAVSAAKAGLARRRLPIVLYSLAVFLFWAALYVYVPTLPVYAEKRGASLGLVGLIVASYGLTQLILRIPLGLASDRWGRRKPFILAGFGVIAVSCLALAWAPSPAWLLVGRGLAGVAASTWVASAVLFASYFPPEQAVRATSVATFVAAGAQMAGTAVGGRLADAGGWLAPFYAGAIVAVIGLAFMLAVPDETLSRRGQATWSTFRRVGTGRLLLAASAIAAVGQYVSQSTTFGFVPNYAAGALSVSRTTLGGLATLTQLAYTVASLLSASLVGRLTARRTLALGLVLAALCTATVPLAHSLPALCVIRLGFGLGYGLLYPVAMGLSITAVPSEERASAMGIFQALYAVGMFAGPAVSGPLAQAVGLRGMFWLTSLLPLGAAAIVACLPRLTRLPTEGSGG